MREIIFRGKRLDNGEWVASSNLLHADDNGKHSYYIPVYGDRFGTVEDEHDNILSIKYGTFYKVDPATVGQYTGLTDKNGEQIFEGDILLLDGEDGYFKLEFDEDTARFVMIGDCVLVDFDNFWSYEVEVVGNIHENQELLEG